MAYWYWLSFGLEVLGSKATIGLCQKLAVASDSYGSLLKDWLDHGLPDV